MDTRVIQDIDLDPRIVPKIKIQSSQKYRPGSWDAWVLVLVNSASY